MNEFLIRWCLGILLACWLPFGAALASGPVNINTASETELLELDGVGPAKARAIVAYRQQHGAFKSVDQLANVEGIGLKTIERNRTRLTIGAES
ncbi:competence protein ComEA [Ahniella affigens]|uniref:Competence protein ComEA n=1 Tax=Ahniella affigens TaxID=2021234 RepID=A0A2P1PMD2_9GAMM|nr:ComEA family DNA-binding protein [Ahniella affigens]AVP96004.1 competence protein ComEA [Ahniella affigens]